MGCRPPFTVHSCLNVNELFSIHINREDGSKSVQLAREKWIEFINQYGLRGDAEFTGGAIKCSAIFDGIDDAVGMLAIRMPLLRVGKVRLGKCPPSNTAINNGNEPPRQSHAIRDVKMRLIESTMSLLVVDEAKQEDVSAVDQWVLMLENTVTVVNVCGSKRKHGDNGQPNETPTFTQPSTPSVKTPTHNYTTANQINGI